MSWQVDGIGDQGRGGIGDAGIDGEHGDGIGDAEGKAAAAPATGGDAAHRVGPVDVGVGEQRRILGPVHQPDIIVRPRSKVDGDVAAVVDMGALQFGNRQHGIDDFLGDRSGDRRHGRDEAMAGVVDGGPPHAARHGALGHPAGGLAQQVELAAQFVQHGGEADAGDLVSAFDMVRLAIGADDQVDGSVLKVKAPAVRQDMGLHPCHSDRSRGQGFPAMPGRRFCPCAAVMSLRSRT